MGAAREAVTLVEVTRSGVVESVHVGHAVVTDADGFVVRSWGDPSIPILPRSANKPFQATAMVELGLDLPPSLLALACASHAAEPMHVEGVSAILGLAGLDLSALGTPADWPLDPEVRSAWLLSGLPPSPVGMNCSGKHAAMLVTAAGRGWSIGDYLSPSHVLQMSILDRFATWTGAEPWTVAVDGCGAPLLGTSLSGLARGMTALASEASLDSSSAAASVLSSMAAFPEMVGGTRLAVTRFMQAVPGLVAKNGAEGVYVGLLPSGGAVAMKAMDGAARAQEAGFAGLLVAAGVDASLLDDMLSVPVLGGGRQVGEVRAVVT